ncbi:MAG: hypothetical protein JXB48_01650 [Candidatus Latescibacteria bacterium]|nr:hypothetical protein [Candidatus Latescibacterota bacterium]
MKNLAYIKIYPSKKTTVILLICGAVLFIPVYIFNLVHGTKALDLITITNLLMAFDAGVFMSIIREIEGNAGLKALFNMYLLNIVSTFGFLLFGSALSLIIARSIKRPVLEKIGYSVPICISFACVIDLCTSVLFLCIARDPGIVSAWMVMAVGISYVTRYLILSAALLWIAVWGTMLTVRNILRIIGR